MHAAAAARAEMLAADDQIAADPIASRTKGAPRLLPGSPAAKVKKTAGARPGQDRRVQRADQSVEGRGHTCIPATQTNQTTRSTPRSAAFAHGALCIAQEQGTKRLRVCLPQISERIRPLTSPQAFLKNLGIARMGAKKVLEKVKQEIDSHRLDLALAQGGHPPPPTPSKGGGASPPPPPPKPVSVFDLAAVLDPSPDTAGRTAGGPAGKAQRQQLLAGGAPTQVRKALGDSKLLVHMRGASVFTLQSNVWCQFTMATQLVVPIGIQPTVDPKTLKP
eukprot:1179725-Prorocentrum_minimum.AAC.1